MDHAASRLGSGLHRNVAVHERQLAVVGGRLSKGLLDRAIERRGDRLAAYADRFGPAMKRRLDRDETRLAALSRALATLDPKRPKPGFARIEDEAGAMIASAAGLSPGQAVRIVFGDGARGATIEGEGAAPRPAAPPAPKPAPRPKPPTANQGDLF
ncbi:exodeoxyribonuclease VII large subunit [compost metagenome]